MTSTIGPESRGAASSRTPIANLNCKNWSSNDFDESGLTIFTSSVQGPAISKGACDEVRPAACCGGHPNVSVFKLKGPPDLPR